MIAKTGRMWLVMTMVAILVPSVSFAKAKHYFNCSDCHRAGYNLTSVNNLCLKCHDAVSGVGTATNDGRANVKSTRLFVKEDISNALESVNPIEYNPATAKDISHQWSAAATKLEAGANPPTTAAFYGNTQSSRGYVFCARCHNAHAQDTAGVSLLKLDNTTDQMCMDCHRDWYQAYTDAYLSHPVGSTVVMPTSDPRFNAGGAVINSNANASIRLLPGATPFVSCTSCHGVHFYDSKASTADGYTHQATLDGDGHQLRSDGPTQANKSALCTSCHAYQEHGKMLDGGESMGCLVCHSGHAYNGGVPNYFVLRNSVTTSTYGTKAITYTSTTQAWNDNTVVTTNGYCEKCHGSAETIPKGAGTHLTTAICRDCHKHKVDGGTYSFQNDASAATCGDCHGFPPYLNARGDRNTGGTDGGYAYKSATHNYSLDASTKTENTTPHNAHAGGGLAQNGDYIFGSGIEACNPCHDGLSQLASHDTATNPGSYRDMAWNSLSRAGTLLNPAYKITTPNQWTCSAVYCHSNGGKRNASGTKIAGDFTTVVTPSWLNGSSPRTLIGTAGECYACHGNSSSTMVTKNNSTSHGKHLGGGTLLKTYSCSACHNLTATSSTALAAGSRLISTGGKHVNGTPDVSFNSSYNLGSAAMGASSPYNGGASGTCQVYCHSNGKGVYAATAPDWDTAATGACGTCHGITAATLTSGSHAIHIDSAKAKIKCDACHGANAQTGTHSGHIDGAITKLTTAASCDACHGVENTAAWDVSPTWGLNTSEDCRTCHTGAVLTSYVNTAAATISVSTANRLSKPVAATTGHNLASGTYPVTTVPAANKNCTACHVTFNTSGHVDGLGNGDLLVGAFSCESCHTTGGARAAEATRKVQTHSNTLPAYTQQKRADFSKLCLACHDPHGTSNGGMLENLRTAQNAKDATGNYAGDVIFSTLLLTNGFDESDTGANANNDDICATCHTTTLHNNRSAAVANHHEGENCTTTCHGHNGANGGFMPTGGTACNDCHGNPPTALDDRPVGKAGAHAAHVKVTSQDAGEDKFDCEVCHPGAATFGLSHGAVPLAAGITNGTCANACHKSTVSDGNWTDSNGLDCTSCHYWSATPTRAGNVTASNSEAVSGTHNQHFDRSKVCVNCHNNNGADVMAPHTHIDDHEAWTLNATNDGSVLTDRGNATQDEATVSFTIATTKYGNWNDGTNSCGVATANSGLGCHATGGPTWGAAGPLACVACHSDKTTSAVNPTSGLHDNTPLVSGKQHDESFTYNGGVSTADCATCHTSSPSTGHQDGVMDATRGAAGNVKVTFAVAVGYTDGAQPTCAPSLTGCHFEQPTKTADWRRKWHEGADNATGACAGCHGDWINGWVTNINHHTNAKAESTHGTKAGLTYECADCHGLESATLTPYPFSIGTNDWRQNAGENTTLHGNGVINVNTNGTGFVRVASLSGCPTCHNNWQTDGKHAYNVTEWTLGTVTADAPTVTCATCHGGLTVGTNANNYWPDKAGNDATEDNNGRHVIHMTRLAQAKYGETIAQLLTNNANGTADAKQKYLCAYCHTSPGADADHGDTVYMPAEVFIGNTGTIAVPVWTRSSKTMWDTADGDATHTTGNCSSVECHNGKPTASTTNFTWYGSGTQNCVVCHNDITVTTAGTTGATHQAHVGAAGAAFGKAIACGSCHGGNPAWSPYTVATATAGNSHIDGQFKVGTAANAVVAFTYSGAYTNAATRTVGDCASNLCHNNGMNGAPYKNGGANYNWQTAFTGCSACHRTDLNLGSSHNPHLAATFTSTFRTTALGCGECHDAVSATDMTGKTAHMDGSVTLKPAGITYSGTPATLTVGGTNTYGVCSASLCHQSGQGANVNSPTWNRAPATADNCTICHNNGASAPQPATGRHAAHLAKPSYVTGCANCHTGATATTIATASHFDGTRNTAGSSSVVYDGTVLGTCTNSCHKVTDGRDWTSGGTSPVLICTDCHQAGTIASGKGALPASGLHNMTATGVKKHDATLGANGCKECHVTPAGSHIDGTFVADSGTNTDRFLNRTGLVYADAAANTGSCYDNGTTGLDYNAGAGCHRDNGVWKRLWSTDANLDSGANPNPGQLVCDVCHGQYQSLNASSKGWREGSVHFRSGASAAENKGSSHNRNAGAANACEDCHAYDSGAGNHQNGVINFSGGAGVPGTYTLTMGNNGTNPGWYCANCHNTAVGESAVDTLTHTFPDSAAFAASYAYVVGVSQPEGGCTGCHGAGGAGGFWPISTQDLAGTADDMNQAGAHPEHVLAIASKMSGGATLGNMNSTCLYCHPGNTHGGADGNLPADVSMTDSDNNGSADAETLSKFKRIVSPFATDTTGYWRRTPGTCTNVACHANAPFTPGWYGDTVAPGNTTNLAVTPNGSRIEPEPGTVELTWTAPGDDSGLDGTAYSYDVRYSTAAITAGNFAAASQAKAPTVDRMSKSQKTVVTGLTPGNTYYFAFKTFDEAGNVSALSNVVSGPAQVDNVAPVFWGINAVGNNDYNFDMTPNPDTNSINVSWDAGRDHGHSLTTPINYLVLWSEYSLRTHFSKGGAMPATIGTDACFNKSVTPPTLITCGTGGVNEYRIKSAQTTALNYDVPALPIGTVYNFLVRAKDPAGNIDSNRAELMAMAKTTNYQTIALQTQYTSAAIPTASTGWSGLPGASTSASNAALGASYPGTAPTTFTLAQNAVVVWSPATTFAIKTNVWGLNYQIKITGNTTGAATLTYQFGYLTGQAFTGLGTAKTMTIPRRAPARVIKFPLTTFKGAVPAGSKPAFVLKNTTASSYSVTLTYGSTANKGGILLFNQQDYNDLPTGLGTLNQSQVYSSFIGGNLYRLTWTAASAVNAGQTVHYDVFGSIDGGASYPYVIGRNLTTNTVDWDPVGDGITGNQTNVKFKVLAGDGYRSGTMLIDGSNANNANHSEVASGVFTVNNTTDVWTPAAIGSATGTADDLKAETRPKQGAVYLTWKAVGNDGFNHGTRATQYDIRYSTATINDANWGTATQAANEPFPNFTGAVEGYELLGLTADAPYYFAMKVGDATGNWSPLSNVATVQSGPKCGICHSTPPDEGVTAGNHIKHGYTRNDCGNCHGTAAASFATDHQDGVLNLGWKTATPHPGIVSGSRLYYTVDGTSGGAVLYDDTTGAGGFVNTGGDATDNGTCAGFNAANANGCHGPATPSWDVATILPCSACHGLSSRTTDTYGRNFDATLDNGMVVPDQIKATPPVDNHGTSTGKYVGAHLKHLNSSFRLAKGDNCKLCHNDNIHADGIVDVAYDLNVTGTGALWTPDAGGAGTPGTCGGTNVENCHGSNTPSWDSAATVACNQCHGFGGVNPAHVTDAGTVRACTWCHPAGHPQGTEQDTNTLMIPNNPLVGIAYRSGGIHLLKNINARGIKTTEAEVCWTCHAAVANNISEWAANTDTVTGSSPYNYGTIFTDSAFATSTANWLGAGTGAYWKSGTTAFQTIKKGKIQSTHSTNTGGTGTVAYDATNKRYNETLDAVADIRCSNCHDVHNMNKAPADTATGTPYLRGSWMGNPYNEDGPPLSTTTYSGVAIGSYNFGAVPRGGTGYRQLGGYYIDQNNVVPMTASTTANAALDDYPTAGWTQESSAGLCILCHGNDVDNMDQKTGEALWLGTNGHSNSAIGGTFTNSANIFDNGAGTASLSGRPVPVMTTSVNKTTQVPDMAYQMQPAGGSTTRGYGYRGVTGTGDAGAYTPNTGTTYAHYAYDWGASVDATSVDQMYHQFSCSKCHNPHASRLPKLLITNCLDIQHNTWDDNKSVQSAYTAATLTDVDRFGGVGQRPAYYASAQNCHRYNDKRVAANKGGWNKVSMWTTPNQ